MGIAWCREKLEQAQNSKSPVDRILIRCSNAIKPKTTFSKPADDIIYKGMRAKNLGISPPVPVHMVPPRARRTRDPSEWHTCSLKSPDTDTDADTDSAPIPPPRKKRKRRINSLELLNTQLELLRQPGYTIYTENLLNPDQVLQNSNIYSPNNPPEHQKRRNRFVKSSESKAGRAKTESHPSLLSNDIRDEKVKNDNTKKAEQKIKVVKNVSTVSLPNYNELVNPAGKVSSDVENSDDKTGNQSGGSNPPHRNSSTISLPGEGSNSILTSLSEATIHRLEAYMKRCRSFGSLKPQQLLEKLEEFNKTRRRASESSDSWSGLDDWDLGVIEYCDPETSSVPPLKPKSTLQPRQRKIPLFSLGPPDENSSKIDESLRRSFGSLIEAELPHVHHVHSSTDNSFTSSQAKNINEAYTSKDEAATAKTEEEISYSSMDKVSLDLKKTGDMPSSLYTVDKGAEESSIGSYPFADHAPLSLSDANDVPISLQPPSCYVPFNLNDTENVSICSNLSMDDAPLKMTNYLDEMSLCSNPSMNHELPETSTSVNDDSDNRIPVPDCVPEDWFENAPSTTEKPTKTPPPTPENEMIKPKETPLTEDDSSLLKILREYKEEPAKEETMPVAPRRRSRENRKKRKGRSNSLKELQSNLLNLERFKSRSPSLAMERSVSLLEEIAKTSRKGKITPEELISGLEKENLYQSLPEDAFEIFLTRKKPSLRESLSEFLGFERAEGVVESPDVSITLSPVHPEDPDTERKTPPPLPASPPPSLTTPVQLDVALTSPNPLVIRSDQKPDM